MDDIWSILAVRLARIVVDDAKTLHAFHHVLKVDVVVVAFGTSLLQRFILAVLYADHQGSARDGMLATRDAQQVGLGKVLEKSLPLFGILLVLEVEVNEVDTMMRTCFGEAILPSTRCCPFLSFFYQLRVVAVILGVVALRAFAAGSGLRFTTGR